MCVLMLTDKRRCGRINVFSTEKQVKRKIYDRLLEWKAKSNGSTALLIDGARRVGKSYIVEEFAKNEYESKL